eukprot:sb/3465043/
MEGGRSVSTKTTYANRPSDYATTSCPVPTSCTPEEETSNLTTNNITASSAIILVDSDSQSSLQSDHAIIDSPDKFCLSRRQLIDHSNIMNQPTLCELGGPDREQLFLNSVNDKDTSPLEDILSKEPSALEDLLTKNSDSPVKLMAPASVGTVETEKENQTDNNNNNDGGDIGPPPMNTTLSDNDQTPLDELKEGCTTADTTLETTVNTTTTVLDVPDTDNDADISFVSESCGPEDPNKPPGKRGRPRKSTSASFSDTVTSNGSGANSSIDLTDTGVVEDTRRIRKPSLKLIESVVNDVGRRIVPKEDVPLSNNKDAPINLDPPTNQNSNPPPLTAAPGVTPAAPLAPAVVTPFIPGVIKVEALETEPYNMNNTRQVDKAPTTPSSYVPVPALPEGWTMRAKARNDVSKYKGRLDICYRW